MKTKPVQRLLMLSCLALLGSCGGASSSLSLSSSSSAKQSSSAAESSQISSSSSSIFGPISDGSNEEWWPDSHESTNSSPLDSSSQSNIDVSSSEESESASSSEGTLSSTAYDESEFTIVESSSGLTPSFNEGVYTIDTAGEYDCSGTLVGMIYIDVPESEDGKSNEVTLNLNGVDMSYAGNSVIYCACCDGLDISAKKNTENYIHDLRPIQTADEEGQGSGAIYAKVDTKLKGTGSLSVTSGYNNGVHSTKDLTIQKQTLTVTAVNNAIKGNDSIDIVSGAITAISSGGDGLKTEDNDISSKNKQRGDITIQGGTVDIYSACDGIQAAHNFYLGGDEEGAGEGSPSVNIHTNKFSSYTNQSHITQTSSATLYLSTTTAETSSYRYAVLFSDNAGTTMWSNATYVKSQRTGGGPGGGGPGGGGGQTNYYYSADIPSSSYTNFILYRFYSSSANSTTSYVAKSASKTLNANYDMVEFTLSGSTINLGSWSNYSTTEGGGQGSKGGEEGNADKADISAKGAKAQNDIYIYGGTMNIQSYDDGLHANYGETLGSGVTSTGDVYIEGGSLTIDASDDGIRADRHLRISGGTVNVTNAYEGLEGNQIYVTGGESYVVGKDDGVNAGHGTSTAGLSAAIDVSGGYLFIQVPSNGDTDGIDSNGIYTQTGGVVITCGPNSGMASALDTDGAVKVNGGTLVALGNSEKTPSTGSGVTSSNASISFSSNKVYTFNFVGGSVQTGTLKYSYSGFHAWSVLGSYQSYSAS